MEGASLGYPSLAVSLEADQQYHLSYSKDVDFSAAAYFTALFAKILLGKKMPEDVQLLKVDVPSDALTKTPWQVTRVAHQRYYEPVRPIRESWDVHGFVTYKEAAILEGEDADSDVYTLRSKRLVSVTPISLDMTSRVELGELEKRLREKDH